MMDILAPLLPPGFDALDISIPYVGSCAIDEGPFESLPIRHGFTTHQVNGRSQLELNQTHSYAQYTALLQTWLFFGFIQAVGAELQLPVELSDFVQHSVGKGESTVTAKPLLAWNAIIQKSQPRTLRRMFKLKSLSSLRQRRDRDSETLADTITTGYYNATIFDFANPEACAESEDRALIILSIKYLIQNIILFLSPEDYMLESYLRNRYVDTARLITGDANESIPPSSNVLKKYLEERGWCPVYANDVLSREPLTDVYIAAAVVPRNGSSSMHRECSSRKGCLAWNVKLDKIRQRHVRQDCNCKLVKPDMSKVYELLQRGEIPVAEVSCNPGKGLSVKVKPAEANIDYTAISHIWADGLASGKENGLLSCQLERIQCQVLNVQAEYRKALVTYYPTFTSNRLMSYNWQKRLKSRIQKGNVNIWIDALCIPVYDPTQASLTTTLKKRAINLMTPTYAGARFVLVLDRQVEEIGKHLKASSPRYKDSRFRALSSLVLHSRWMQRCWTLQEGALAQILCFQCHDWLYTGEERLNNTEGLRDVQLLIESLLSRSTSMPSDLDSILANLALLDAGDFMDFSKEQRVKAFLRSLTHSGKDQFPLNLLLRRQDMVPQKRRSEWWIPDLDSRASFYSDGSRYPRATLCEYGVLFRCQYSRLNPLRLIERLPSSPRFWLRYEDHLFWIELDLHPGDFGIANLAAHDSACILFFWLDAHLSLPQNPRGFIHRGFCVTRTGDPRSIASISQDTHEERSALPVHYNCAFSYGVSTPLSSQEFRSSPVVPVEMSTSQANEDTYLIQTDVASWPDVKAVRTAKNEMGENHTYQNLSIFTSCSIFVLFIAALALFLARVSGLKKISNIRLGDWVIYCLLGALAVALLLIFIGVTRLRVRRQRRGYRRWVQSFALKERVD